MSGYPFPIASPQDSDPRRTGAHQFSTTQSTHSELENWDGRHYVGGSLQGGGAAVGFQAGRHPNGAFQSAFSGPPPPPEENQAHAGPSKHGKTQAPKPRTQSQKDAEKRNKKKRKSVSAKLNRALEEARIERVPRGQPDMIRSAARVIRKTTAECQLLRRIMRKLQTDPRSINSPAYHLALAFPHDLQIACANIDKEDEEDEGNEEEKDEESDQDLWADDMID
ncbi:hypothetical protein SISNIDRAFT_482937 [Sistotremastrum niveocremeum HHB9708]|uniref:Uncharacterized protein n=2 Tax=Sistotremastraceae TaxID=3402574 RepID=A0A164XWM7_9AGAM|nr:hypothetical protein SISNIDRAFT_482937 [Sistotremastrum niveocremeum HHB9708]KZT36152.1 hypothetical protein SISSUDRAFT_1063888 [Sistotremastrum suecicum HHB10207 ss-3]